MCTPGKEREGGYKKERKIWGCGEGVRRRGERGSGGSRQQSAGMKAGVAATRGAGQSSGRGARRGRGA